MTTKRKESIMRILLTGFEPFGGSDINSSWEAASRIGTLSLAGTEMVVRQLPVSFRRVGNVIKELLEEIQPDVIVMLGQRSSSTSIDIERIAVNLMDSKNSDNDGYIPNETPIYSDSPLAYSSNLPVKSLRDCLTANGIEAKVSNSAGLYVCNCTYYEVLRTIEHNNLKTKAVFVHVPKISDSIDVEHLTNAVTTIIKNINQLI